jgi:alkyl hydroperoxide reductase subunit AhpF
MEFILLEEIKEVPVEEDKYYDLIIIGAGPAGMTAGVYAGRKKLDTLVISKNGGVVCQRLFSYPVTSINSVLTKLSYASGLIPSPHLEHQ